MAPSLLSRFTQLLAFTGAIAHAAPGYVAPTASDPVVLAQFPNETWVENVAVRSNGKVLATILLPFAAVYQIDPCATEDGPQLVANLTQASGSTSAAGIAEYKPDVFAVIVNDFNLTSLSGKQGTNALWTVDMGAFDAGRPQAEVASKLADLPEATTPNGLTASHGGSVLLATDSIGLVLAIDTATGASQVVLSATDGTPEIGTPIADHDKLGANGIKTLGSNLFVTNSNTQTLLRFPLAPNGLPASRTPQVVAEFDALVDDFDLAADGSAFVVSDLINTLWGVTPSGKVTAVLGSLNSSQVLGGTSAVFGRTPDALSTLYLGLAGGIAAPLNGTFIQGGQVIAVKTNKVGA